MSVILRRSLVRASLWGVALFALGTSSACTSDEGPSIRQGDGRDTAPALGDSAEGGGDGTGDGVEGDATVAPDTTVAPDATDATDAGDGEATDSAIDTAEPDGDTVADASLEAGASCPSDAACASGHCLLGHEGRRCAAGCGETPCPDGLECRSVGDDRVCVDAFAALCMPCREHGECNLGEAAGLGDLGDVNLCLGSAASENAVAGRYCGVACGEGRECPAGFACREGQCRASDESCECSALAVMLVAETACAKVAEGDGGAALCTGSRRCESAGAAPTACDAEAPTAETCNGRDDDCDGQIDERGESGGVDCQGFACGGAAGCLTACEGSADCAPGLGCDTLDMDGDEVLDECLPTGADGSTCAGDSQCDSGYCDNDHCCTRGTGPPPTCCAEDADCAALDGFPVCDGVTPDGCGGHRIVGRCQDARCVTADVPAPEACAGELCRDGQCLASGVFDGPHLCDWAGTCAATADATCNDGEACTNDSCSTAQGCLTTPRNGVIEARCYTFDAATRQVGQCADGFTSCDAGAPEGCVGERGPADETCNGLDDDCDGASDEGTETACFPYLCGGVGGCRTGCGADGECAAGHFCQAGACVGTGQDGAACEDGGECQSGHCEQGVCCAAGLCCNDDGDCASLDTTFCDSTEVNGCAGTRVSGVCGAGSVCGTSESDDASACTGQACAAGSCEGTTRVGAGVCAGADCVRAASAQCTPYLCAAGACTDGCQEDSQCSGGSVCREGRCVSLPDGAACERSEQCAGGHCENGYCCKGAGACCAGIGHDEACTFLDGDASCTNASGCDGTRKDGQCGSDFHCKAVDVAAPEACRGISCGPTVCVNLEGGDWVLEGAKRNVCNGEGDCVATVRDCRDNEASSYCTSSSSAWVTCENCSPNRQTCVVFDNPCYCE